MVIYLPSQSVDSEPILDELTPREIVRELDKHVIGQADAKRAVVELAKEWRTDKILRHLEALLLVADVTNMYIVSGNGDVVEPDEAIAAIGSGGPFAMAAATALLRNTQMPARQLVEQAMQIAAKICIYTNDNITYEELG